MHKNTKGSLHILRRTGHPAVSFQTHSHSLIYVIAWLAEHLRCRVLNRLLELPSDPHTCPCFLPLCFRPLLLPCEMGMRIHKSFLKHYLNECDYVEVFYVYNFAPPKAAQDL